HAAFFERHWSKMVKDIRKGSLDEHLPISKPRRDRLEMLMVPNPKRARLLDDALRVLGFHARSSGSFNSGQSGNGQSRHGAARGGNVSEDTEGEAQESLSRRVESTRKRPASLEGLREGSRGVSGNVATDRRRRSVAAGEPEADHRIKMARKRSRARSPSLGDAESGMAIQDPEKATRAAYELLTAPRGGNMGTQPAPSGRSTLKYVCMHPGCGATFAMEMSAKAHAQREHCFRRHLGEFYLPSPFSDQFLSTAWPKDVPWLDPLGPLTRDESTSVGRHRCRVPSCRKRFATARHLALHSRVGHTEFDLERSEARGGNSAGDTRELMLSPSKDLWREVTCTYIGTYRLAPPFEPPSGCPLIPSCTKHIRLKGYCPHCKEVMAKASGATGSHGGPIPPAKFYTRAKVKVNRHGRSMEFDLDGGEPHRTPLLSFPPSHPHPPTCHPTQDTQACSSWEDVTEKGTNGGGLGTAVGVGGVAEGTGNKLGTGVSETLQQRRVLPVRVVALLEDGAGRGWVAARCLWEGRDIGERELSRGGLQWKDIDHEQELFLGTEVEYLPLSFVTDICYVKVGRREEVHAKQRVGDLPKPIRLV
ncbi:unnamed protein product, partial [Discosporangium mesarthrocarpum]